MANQKKRQPHQSNAESVSIRRLPHWREAVFQNQSACRVISREMFQLIFKIKITVKNRAVKPRVIKNAVTFDLMRRGEIENQES